MRYKKGIVIRMKTLLALLLLIPSLSWSNEKPQGYCEWVNWLINNHQSSLMGIYEDLYNAKKIDSERMRKFEDRLFKLATTYDKLCK